MHIPPCHAPRERMGQVLTHCAQFQYLRTLHKIDILISDTWMCIKRRAPALPMALTAISSVAFTSVGAQIVSEQKRGEAERAQKNRGKNENAIKADLAPGQSQRQTQCQRTATAAAAAKPAVHPLRLAAGLCVWPGSDFPSLWCPRLAIGLHATNANRHCQHKQLPLHLPNKPLQTTGRMPNAAQIVISSWSKYPRWAMANAITGNNRFMPQMRIHQVQLA